MGKARRRAEEPREKEVGIIVEKQEKIYKEGNVTKLL